MLISDIKLTHTVKCNHIKGAYVPSESHSCFELVYYLYGQGTVKVNEQIFSIASNTFVLIPPEAEHSETHEANCELYFMRFSSPADFSDGFFTDNYGEIQNLVKTIYRESFDQNSSYKELINLKLNELHILMQRFKNSDTTNHSVKNYDYVISYIMEHYHEKISLESLATPFHFTYNYFQHQFKKQTGYSPKQFLIKRRIDVAKKLLLETTLNCTEISYKCGFTNSAQFSSIFKRETGSSPLEYRKNFIPQTLV